MARPKPNQEPEEREQRRPQRKSGLNPFIPLLIVVVLLGGGVLAVMSGGKKKEEPKVESTKPVPFSDLPPEEPPKKRASSGSGRSFVAEAPEGLAKDANWVKALKIAAEGEALFEEATAAKVAGNTTLLNEKGAASRDKLNEAVDLTALWEEELLTKYGDANPEVRRIMSTRSSWIDKLRWLHKSSSR